MTDNNILVKRCNDRFKYTYNGKNHFYTPDFIVNITYIEIKGREVEKDLIKYSAVRATGNNIIILYKNDLLIMFEYVKNKYNI